MEINKTTLKEKYEFALNEFCAGHIPLLLVFQNRVNDSDFEDCEAIKQVLDDYYSLNNDIPEDPYSVTEQMINEWSFEYSSKFSFDGGGSPKENIHFFTEQIENFVTD